MLLPRTKTWLLATAGALMLPAASTVAQDGGSSRDALLEGFQQPGEAARPRVWWHWMNGNVTWEGAQADMDWMKRVGIAGLQAFDAGSGMPQMVETRLPYMTDAWKDVFRKTAAYADKLDLELGIAASPGWSETGGPWVTGPDAMKKMAWSATRVSGGRPFSGQLAKPPSTTGIFQSSTAGGSLGGRAEGQSPPELYVDQKVLAFPVPADSALPTPTITASGGSVDAARLGDGNIQASALDLPAGSATGDLSWVQFDYGRAVTIRGLTLATPLAGFGYVGLMPRKPGAAPTAFRLEASDDGRAWRDTGAKVEGGMPERTTSVDNVRGRYFRFVSVRQAPEPPVAVLPRWSRQSPPPPETIPISELVLRGEATVHSFEDKAAYANNGDYYALPAGTSGRAVPKSSQVIDLTDRMTPDGRLNWTPPAGEWQVLRIGYSLTGAMNRPASPEATGLEVDKLDPAAVKRYMDHYLGMYRDASGGLLGKRGLRAMMFDSWEASNANWTPKIIDDFKRLRGYDPTPWLPAMAGYVVESPERSDAFLWDWRRTIQELLKVNHYELLTGMLHDIGMIRYGEGHEAGFSTVGDGMEMKQSADVPMAAMWQVNRPGEIEATYFNDIQESASVAHIYGQNLVATEALTGGPRFGTAPWDLKPTADAILLAGSNRFVIHTSAHQPVSRGPGVTLGVGQYFTRNETWAEQAKPWVDYLSRASYMLQQGQSVSDVAVFAGEAGPTVATYRGIYPAVPTGYRYDYVNGDAIRTRLKSVDGSLVTETGMRYRALFFGKGTKRVSLPVLQKVLALVQGGATLIGERPEGSPSLADDPAKVKAVLDALWPGGSVAQVGRGRVFAAADTAAALGSIAVAPDFSYQKPQADSEVLFLHRHLADGDVYFLSNRLDRAETVRASFRVAGKAPELWDAATGLTRPAGYRTVGGRTEVDVPLDRFGSTFVVFRKNATAPSASAPGASWRTLTTLDGPWAVAFQADRGAPATATFPKLADFRENSDPGIRYFSGVARYTKDVTLARSDLGSGKGVWLDLGQVNNLAEVWVNGKLAGTAWKPPYRVDIGAFVMAGRNRIEVRSVNLWVNRLIGDVQPGVTRKITFTAADGRPVAGSNTEAGRNRSQMPYKATDPLVPSGLIGPVTIQRETD